MIGAEGFRMVELLGRQDLEAHPVWADFHEERDRARILSWGVSPARLDAEVERYDYCGRAPLYPVLDLAETRAVACASIALHITLPGGESLGGYRVGESAFGVFVGDEEFCLNPSLPSRSRNEIRRLAAALDRSPDDLLPMQYESVAELGTDGRLTGELAFQ